MPHALIIRARTTALVIRNTLEMALTVKVRLFSAMPFISLELVESCLLSIPAVFLNVS